MSNQEGPTKEKYLFDQGQHREVETVERLLLSGLFDDFTRHHMYWPGWWSWYAIRIPTELVLPAGIAPKAFPGDIDVMGGPLEADRDELTAEHERYKREMPDAHPTVWLNMASRNIALEGRLTWPPSLAKIGAAEVKAVYLDADLKLKATRIGRIKKFLKQARGLSKMGFDRAALIWIGVTEPVVAQGLENGAHWLHASSRASHMADQLTNLLQGHQGGGFGQMIIPVGAVPGGLEDWRGASELRLLEQPEDIDRVPGSQESTIRGSVESFLQSVFAKYPVPTSGPVVVRACAPGGCGEVFIAEPPSNRTCPSCGREID